MPQNSEGLQRRLRDSKARADFPERVAAKVRALQESGFYGRLTISLQDGIPQNLKLEESMKPDDL